MWLYKFGKRKGFGIMAVTLIVLALLVAFSGIFNWLIIPHSLALPFGFFKALLAFLVVICWIILNIPPPKLPTGKFLIAFAELGEELSRDGGYEGDLRAERRRPMNLPGRAEAVIDYEDELAEEGADSATGSRYLDNIKQSRRAKPSGILPGTRQSRALPPAPQMALSRTRDNYAGLDEEKGSTTTALLHVPVRGHQLIGNDEPVTTRPPIKKFTRPEYLDAWQTVGGPRELTNYLRQELHRQIVETDLDDLAIFPIDFADDATTATQLASQSRAQAVIWGWNAYHTRRDFVPVFELLKPLEDAPPPSGDMQVMGLSSFDLGLQAGRFNTVFRAFVIGLGAYGLRRYEQARNEFSLALVSSYMNESFPRYNNRVDRAIIYFYLGNSYYFSGQFEKAYRCYQEAWAIDGELYEARHNIGVVLVLQGKPDFAIKSLVGVVRDNPNLAVARYNLGMAYLEKKDFNKGRRELSNSIKIDPRFAAAYRGLGLSYFREQLQLEENGPKSLDHGDSSNKSLYDEAIAYLGESLKIKTDYARARVDLGRIRQHQANLITAIQKRLLSVYDKANGMVQASILSDELRLIVGDLLLLKHNVPEMREAANQSVMALQDIVAELQAGSYTQARIRKLVDAANVDLRASCTKLLVQATAELQEALRLDPSLAEAHYMLGLCLRDQSNLEDAIAALKEVIRLRADYRDMNYALSRYALGEIYRQRGQDDLAEKEFEEATRARAAVSPVSVQDYINQGIGYLANEQFGEAREAFEKALELEPENAEALLNLGTVYQETGNYNNAFSLYQNVLKLPNPPEAVYNRLSTLYHQMGDEKSAFDTIKKAAEKNQRSSRLQFWLGNAYRRQKDETQAMACYINAFRIDPDNADARFNLAMIYLSRKQYQDAILQFGEVVRIRPEDVPSHTFLGRASLQMGMTDEAISSLKEAIRLKPDSTDAMITLGQIYQRQNEAELAVGQFETALTYSPNDQRIRELLASAYALAGKVDLSIEQFQAILAADPNQAQAHYNLGVSFTSKDRFDLAAREFIEYVRLRPDDADGYFNLGLAFKEQMMVMESIQSLSKAIELKPDFAIAYQMRGQLYIAINENEKGIADLTAFQKLKA